MKKLLLTLSMLMASQVFAGEILVKSISQYELWGSSSADAEFEINPDMGRAWVKVSISSGDPDGGSSDEERVKIEGLSYDKHTGSINIEHEGRITTCAEEKMVGRFIFRNKMLKMTSACKFVGRWRKISYDDGFEIKKTARYDIFLIVE